MNISQHAFVPYTRYVIGYYNSLGNFSANAQLRSNVKMPLPYGVNTYQVFNFRGVSGYSTLRVYNPYHTSSVTDGIAKIQTGENFSSTRSPVTNYDVRIVGWNQPVPQLLGINLFPNVSTNELNDDLI